MARTVREIMNSELVATRAGEKPELTREKILALGISAVPVLDDDQRPTGVLSLRELLGAEKPAARPVLIVSQSASIEEASRLLAETDRHQLVVVDAAGRAVGMVSAVDLLRALLGMPARHPVAFPHYDTKLGVEWSDDAVLEQGRETAAPAMPGILVIVRGGQGVEETAVWAESCGDVRARVAELVSLRSRRDPGLAKLMAGTAKLRFRAAAVPDAFERGRVLGEIQRELPVSDRT